jgi:uncharacterized protein (TIGR02117 family)
MYFNQILYIVITAIPGPYLKKQGWRIVLLFVSLLGACAANPLNPETNDVCEILESRAFYIVNHGLHTGIVVKRKDLLEVVPSLINDWDSGEYLEVGWGDEKFYRAPNATAGLAIQAMLWPTASVLHLVAILESPQRSFPKLEILEISVPDSGYQKLLEYIADTFERTSDDHITRLGPGLYGNSYFYKATGSFHTFNTCNTWVARAIETTGYPISSDGIIRAESLLSQLRRGVDSGNKCFSVR